MRLSGIRWASALPLVLVGCAGINGAGEPSIPTTVDEQCWKADIGPRAVWDLLGPEGEEPIDPKVYSPIWIQVEDVDGDGTKDVVVVRGGLDGGEQGAAEVHFGPFTVSGSAMRGARLWRQTPARQECSAENPPVRFFKAALANLDGGTHLDLVIGSDAGVFVYTNPGAAGTTPPQVLARCKTALAVAAEDLDGNGKAELIASVWNPGSYAAPLIFKDAGTEGEAWSPYEFDLPGSVVVVHEGTKPAGVLFGVRALRQVGDPATAADGTWGAYFPLKDGKLADTPIRFQDTIDGAPPGTGDQMPVVMDLDDFDESPYHLLLVTRTYHWCNGCGQRGRPELFKWVDGQKLERLDKWVTYPYKLPPGNWQQAGIGDFDADGGRDIVLGRGCSSNELTQFEGPLWILSRTKDVGSGPTFHQVVMGMPDERLARASAVARLRVGDRDVQVAVTGATPASDGARGSVPSGIRVIALTPF